MFTWHGTRGWYHEHESYTGLTLFSEKLQNKDLVQTGLFRPHTAGGKTQKNTQVKILREDLSIQTGKWGQMFMVGMLAQTLAGGGGTLSSQVPLGKMPKLRTSFSFAAKEQQMLCILLRP